MLDATAANSFLYSHAYAYAAPGTDCDPAEYAEWFYGEWSECDLEDVPSHPAEYARFLSIMAARADEPHTGHRSHFTGAWYCDTCDSPYCDNA